MISICRWPLDKEKCGETRCLTCAPAIMAASQVFALIFFFVLRLEKLLAWRLSLRPLLLSKLLVPSPGATNDMSLLDFETFFRSARTSWNTSVC